jgi:hypothetical protein
MKTCKTKKSEDHLQTAVFLNFKKNRKNTLQKRKNKYPYKILNVLQYCLYIDFFMRGIQAAICTVNSLSYCDIVK